MRSKRDSYKNAIDKVRSAHQDNIASPHDTVECPRCRTRQVLTDAPGMRVCIRCGFEFRPKYGSGARP